MINKVTLLETKVNGIKDAKDHVNKINFDVGEVDTIDPVVYAVERLLWSGRNSSILLFDNFNSGKCLGCLIEFIVLITYMSRFTDGSHLKCYIYCIAFYLGYIFEYRVTNYFS